MTLDQKDVRTPKPSAMRENIGLIAFAGVCVLAEALALSLPVFHKPDLSVPPKSQVSSVQKIPFRSYCVSDRDYRDAMVESGPPPKLSGSDYEDQDVLLGTITRSALEYSDVGLDMPKFGAVTEKQTVKVGDVVHGRSFDRYHPKVTKIDDRGVELDGCDKIRYGRTDERGGKFVLMDFVRADEGPEEGAAVISITYPVFPGMTLACMPK